MNWCLKTVICISFDQRALILEKNEFLKSLQTDLHNWCPI